MPPPSDQKLLTSTLWYRFVVDAINNSGLDGLQIAQEAGLDTRLLDFPEATVPDDIYFPMMQLAQARSGDPDYGLRAAGYNRLTAFGALGYSMMSAADLRGALERTSRYSRTMTQATSAQLHAHEHGALFELFLVTPSIENLRPAYDFFILFMLNFLRWTVGTELNPIEVALPYAKPEDAKLHQQLFGCPVHFGTKRITMLFSQKQLALPLLTADAVMSEVHDRYADERMLRFGSIPFAQHTRRILIQLLPDGEPTRKDIARQLRMSESTLQRRLKDEGIQYQELLDETRRSLTQMHLANNNISLSETAVLLGFSEQSSFNRAVRRWFSCSPGEMRMRLRADKSTLA